MDEKKELLILTPFELPDSRLAMEVAKTGAFPVLHLGRDKKTAEKELEKLSKLKKPFGVCINSEKVGSVKLPSNVSRIIAPFGTKLPAQKGVEVIFQIHSVQEAIEAIKQKSKAIIIKGNEGAGKVSDDSSFILFQALIGQCRKEGVKVYIQGGAGIHTSAAYMALGAQGIVFDSQIVAFPECDAPKELKDLSKKLSGSETILVDNFRVLHRNNSPALPVTPTFKDLLPYLGGYDLSANYLPIGQDVALAVDFFERYKKLDRLVSAFFEAAYGHLLQAKKLNIIGAESEMAKDLGIKYPIAQGPMARVSDVPEFINDVAKEGALPFFAMSLMHGKSVEDLLEKTSELLGDKPWGVGMLGFTLPQLRDEQTKNIIKAKPKVVLIAGGRPSLAKPFEDAGIKVLLHVPSTALLDMFLKEGARNFIFEGRESGGHVGPLLSMVLWEKQINRLLKEDDKSTLRIFFAGGIHDAFSSAFVSIMSATLAAKGAKIGVLMGTSYLYTKEAVKSGAITSQYQKQIVEKKETILLEAAPGQETRSVKSPFTERFAAEKKRMLESGMDSREVWLKLEEMNLGCLRVASKGTERQGDKIVKISPEEQLEKALYMTGEVTTLIDKTTTIEKLHKTVAVDNNKVIQKLEDIDKPVSNVKPLDIAIVGMECIFPDAPNVDEYWKNLFLGKDCVTEVPDSRWNKEIFYNPDTKDTDQVVSKWGGFIPWIDFDPVEFGIAPQSLASIEPVQLLSLLVAKRALEDAGYTNLAEVDMDNTSVIFGAEGATELASAYGARAGAKQLFGDVPEEVKKALPRLNEDSFAGILSNVISGRITNRLNLGGRNYTVDAACASSLAAVDLACHELYSNRSDMVIVGGADFHNGINDFLMFSCTYALSKKGYCASFDADSDGITLGEGIGVLVLKRLEDAEREGNKIYAVIKGVGGSSDGRSLGMTAPNRKGQIKALERAYQSAGILPSEVGMVEAHGTGTVVGDRTEMNALTDMFLDSGAMKAQTYIGSVKTQIGHAKCAAGIAGLIKATLSVYHGIVPPTIHLNKPNTSYNKETSPFVFNTETGLWGDERRIAGISAFGFGGTNFHTIIENYKSSIPETTSLNAWPSELFVFRGKTLEDAKAQMQKVKELLTLNDKIRLRDIAFSLAIYSKDDIQISIVAGNVEELLKKIESANEGKKDFGVYYRDVKDGKVAFLFSGQGSQRVNMARSLFVAFPSMRRLLNENKEYEKIIFPDAVFDDEAKKAQQKTITDTRNAQPLLGMVDWAIADFLQSLGIKPDMVAGHSYGELAALCFAGAFDPSNLTSLSHQRALAILDAVENDKGKMAAMSNVSEEQLSELLKDEKEVWAVNFNSTKQIVLAGTTNGMDAFLKKMAEKGIACKEINVACAFHSPLLKKAKDLYAKVLKDVAFKAPKVQVWSNTTAEAYPSGATKIKERLAEHLVKPVLFTKQVQNMYEAGARVFIETGPGGVLSGLVQTTLGDGITSIQTENRGGEGVTYLLKAIAQYLATGKNADIEKLFKDRNASIINIDDPEQYKKNSTIWHINGHYAAPTFGKMPEDGYYPLINPLKSLNLMSNNINIENLGADRIMYEYLEGMRALIDNQREIIQNQRDVMLSYFGTAEIPQRVAVKRAATQDVLELKESDVVETADQEAPAEAQGGSGLPPISSLSSEEIRNMLLDAISEKTGYPIDMLGLDMDLEADLSIDSIKRLEIIGALREKIDIATLLESSEQMIEKMASIKTINELVDWITELGKMEVTPKAEGSGSEKAADIQDATIVEDDTVELAQFTFAVQPYPMNKDAEKLSIKGQKFAVTDDGGELAKTVKKEMTAKGAKVTIVTAADDLSGYDGIVLINSSTAAVKYPIKDFFKMLKTAKMDSIKWVYTFSDVVGKVIAEKGNKELKNIQGYPGLIKSLTHEYPTINFRVVEFHTLFDAAALPQIVCSELEIKESFPEIIYQGAERMHFDISLEDLQTSGAPALGLDKDSVVLVLGGAQGITPELVSQLAADYPCNYVLVGRSSVLTEEENKYAALKTRDDIRKYLIAEEGMKVPAEIEKKLQKIFKSNQIAESVSKIEKAGGKVTYKSVDVANVKDFKAFVKEVKKEYGKIDGVIHAAGILDDKLFEQKTWKSFEQVYQTKVNPLAVIVDELLPSLKLLVMFSSASSAFGNRGQSDYAAGNSVLDLTALVLTGKKSEARVVSFNWGPWKGAGMVSSSLENEFKKRGVAMIPLKEGGEYFVNELKYGKEPAILVMGGKGSDIENFLKGQN